MMRITEICESDAHITLQVEGQIVSHWVAELEHAIKRVLQSGRQVVLDFHAVQVVGPRGLQMLRQVTSDNMEIVNCSELIEDLLRQGMQS